MSHDNMREVRESLGIDVDACDAAREAQAAKDAETHYFASTAFGWATADTRKEAIEKLVNAFRSDLKHVVKAEQKQGRPGAYIWTCRVNGPADAPYKIEWFAPKGIEWERSREYHVTYLTNKDMAYGPHSCNAEK